ncbi:MAG: hypothetical protein KAI53_04550 [Candidatus Aenigmarchaeota archaeon]|nr:hypothetical protein [Candidatus Aenigmarchaeota archaeon]
MDWKVIPLGHGRGYLFECPKCGQQFSGNPGELCPSCGFGKQEFGALATTDYSKTHLTIPEGSQLPATAEPAQVPVVPQMPTTAEPVQLPAVIPEENNLPTTTDPDIIDTDNTNPTTEENSFKNHLIHLGLEIMGMGILIGIARVVGNTVPESIFIGGIVGFVIIEGAHMGVWAMMGKHTHKLKKPNMPKITRPKLWHPRRTNPFKKRSNLPAVYDGGTPQNIQQDESGGTIQNISNPQNSRPIIKTQCSLNDLSPDIRTYPKALEYFFMLDNEYHKNGRDGYTNLFRKLALKLHPDHGGDDEEFRYLSRAKTEMKRIHGL